MQYGMDMCDDPCYFYPMLKAPEKQIRVSDYALAQRVCMHGFKSCSLKERQV